jgi:hypothetical protein
MRALVNLIFFIAPAQDNVQQRRKNNLPSNRRADHPHSFPTLSGAFDKYFIESGIQTPYFAAENQ